MSHRKRNKKESVTNSANKLVCNIQGHQDMFFGADDKGLTVECTYCGKKYSFKNASDLDKIPIHPDVKRRAAQRYRWDV